VADLCWIKYGVTTDPACRWSSIAHLFPSEGGCLACAQLVAPGYPLQEPMEQRDLHEIAAQVRLDVHQDVGQPGKSAACS